MVKPEPNTKNPTAENTIRRSRMRLWLVWAVQYWRELLDFRFDKYMIVQVLPGVYGLLLVAIAASLLFFTVVAFTTNLWYGLWFLLIGCPLGFLVCASVLRGVLEFYLVVFRISENVDDLVGIRDTVDRLSGIGETVDQMVSVTRRIPFWNIITSSPKRTTTPSRRERRTRHDDAADDKE